MKFYVNKKATDIQRSLTSFEQEYVKKQGNMRKITKIWDVNILSTTLYMGNNFRQHG